MTESVIGLVEDHAEAQQVRSELVRAGCDRNAIVIVSGQGGDGPDDLVRDLVERGYAEDKARRYAAAVQRGGGILIAVEADNVARALEAMNRCELKTPEELLARAGGSAAARRGRRDEEEEEEEVERARSVEEELHVGKEQVTGGKRLVTKVTEQEVAQPVTLREEAVEVERRRPAERRLSPEEAAQAFQERTVEITATSERPVISKEARVTGEVALRKHAGERRETIRETVRRSDVVVEDIKEQKEQARERR